MNERVSSFGLLRRRTCLVPTWRGWVLILLIITALVLGFFRGIHGFLAVHTPVPGGTLVIEGWSSDYVIEGALEDYRKSQYERICLTGGPIEFGNAMREHRTYADYAKALCIRLGIQESVLHAVPAPAVQKDRSYASGLALREWLRGHGGLSGRVNIAGNGAHSRRTRLLYEKALGLGVEVGISNIDEVNYDPKRWWATSQGFRTVLNEAIAYFYARFLFHPKVPQS